ncbi:MAG: hypothetical protein H7122_13075 [Chitinophagaceae bacterium]|nr:hypothetical protein [Chitinophagaceae bacterium]
METSNKSTGLYWLLFFASLAGAVVVWITIPQIITLTLPFICTFFAKAMNIM